jgi:hypothetical protein
MDLHRSRASAVMEQQAAMLAAWIAATHVESASATVEGMRVAHLSKDSSDPLLDRASDAVLDRACGHEAAHAAVALALGLAISFARVNPDGSGSAAYSGDAADAMLMTAVTDLAGIAFELLTDSADEGRQFHLANSHDVLVCRLRLDELRKAAPDICPDPGTLAKLALCTVAEHLDNVFRIAAALRAEGELDGAAIAAFCHVAH